MSLKVEQKYPICDTDLWLKVCKKNKDVIFCQYNNIYISDAVLTELEYKNDDNPKKFGHGLENYHKEIKKGRVHSININSKIFSEAEKNQAIKLFLHHDIPYIPRTNIFPRAKHMGEKVSVIYAAILNLELVLSDDGGADSFADKYFNYVPVIRLPELLKLFGLSSKQIISFTDEVNKALDETVTISETTVKSFRELKSILKYS